MKDTANINMPLTCSQILAAMHLDATDMAEVQRIVPPRPPVSDVEKAHAYDMLVYAMRSPGGLAEYGPVYPCHVLAWADTIESRQGYESLLSLWLRTIAVVWAHFTQCGPHPETGE